MRQKKTTLTEGISVPFVITKTTLTREPTLKRTSRFVGVRAGLTKLAYALATKAIEIVEEAFFEKDMEIDDGGVIEQTHYAVYVDTEAGRPSLRVEETPWKPGCGAHYEIVKVQSVSPPSNKVQDRPADEIESTRQILLERMGLAEAVADPATPELDLEPVLNGTNGTQESMT